MMYRSFLSALCIALYLTSAPLDATEKALYIYDATSDCVRNQKIMNPNYGTDGWSYQQNNREDSLIRATRFYPEDIAGRSLIDFGCNDGGITLACRELGASQVIGIEYNPHCLTRARQQMAEKHFSHVNFIGGDMENKALLATLPQVDTVLLLAILDTSEFANKTSVIANLARFAKRAMYYEGHVTADSHVSRFYDFLTATDFTRFEYLGRFEGRLLMRFGREMVTSKDLPKDAVTSDCSDAELLEAEKIYLFTDSARNPPFSSKCRLIQFVSRSIPKSTLQLLP